MSLRSEKSGRAGETERNNQSEAFNAVGAVGRKDPSFEYLGLRPKYVTIELCTGPRIYLQVEVMVMKDQRKDRRENMKYANPGEPPGEFGAQA